MVTGDAAEETPRRWTLSLPRGRAWSIGPRVQVLGVINVTPDSFSDGGRYRDSDEAVDAGLELLAEGADALDIGGESTRPGSDRVSAREQLRRVLPVLERLREATDAPLSVDTSDPVVGAEVLACGADMINDVEGLRRPEWGPLLAGRPDVPVILMHMQGTPKTMQDSPSYPRGVVPEIRDYFERALGAAERAGIASERVILDPGVGFGKRLQHNLLIIRGLHRLRVASRPLLVGLSRKGFIGKLLSREAPERDVGTLAANAAAIFSGADLLRVHNARYTRDLVDMVAAVRGVGEREADEV